MLELYRLIKAVAFVLINTWGLTANPVIGQIPSLVEGWPYKSATLQFAVETTVRFDTSGGLLNSSLFFGTMTGEIHRRYFDCTPFPGWPIVADTLLFGTTPTLFDIDHDGQLEMLIMGTRRISGYAYSLIFLFDDNGEVMSGFPINMQRPLGLSAADIDCDGEYEIITYSVDENLISCFDRYGINKPGWPIDIPYDLDGGTSRGGGAAIGDIDLDGKNDYVVAGSYHIYAFRFDGSVIESYPINISDSNYVFNQWGWPPTLGDIDSDGFPEILISGGNWVPGNPHSSFIAIYEHDGAIKEGWPIYYQNEHITFCPIPSDINNDGQVEIGFMTSQLHFVDLAGMELPGWPKSLGRTIWSDLVMADIDGDNNLEIFSDFNAIFADSMGQDSNWYYGHSLLFAMDYLGNDLPGYPIEVNGEYLERPPTFAYDAETHRLYMALCSDMELSPFYDADTLYFDLYVFPDSTGPPDQWPMLDHDNLHTRNYNFVDNVIAINDGEPIIPGNYALMQNYPNPFNSSTIIEFDLPREEIVNLSVYDILGRKVAEPLKDKLVPGRYSRRIELVGKSSGIYYCVLATEKMQIGRKMILLK